MPMPMSIYSKLSARQLKETGVIIQLAGRFVVYPEGVLEDVLVQVDNLIFLVDFYVLSMKDDKSPNSSDLLLGRPFLSTAKTKIDIQNGTLTMEFDSEIVRFNMYDAIKYPFDLSYACNIDALEVLNQQHFNLSYGDKMNIALCNNLNADSLRVLEKDNVASQEL